jgi:hypothetical protein
VPGPGRDLEGRALPALSDYVMRERPAEVDCPWVFLVGSRGKRWCEPLSYDAMVRMFARAAKWAGVRDAWLTLAQPSPLARHADVRGRDAGADADPTGGQRDAADYDRLDPPGKRRCLATAATCASAQARIRHPGGSRVPGPGQSSAGLAEGR